MAKYKTVGFLRANDGEVIVTLGRDSYTLANINSITAAIEYSKVSFNQLGNYLTQHALTTSRISGKMDINLDTTMWDTIISTFTKSGLMPYIKVTVTNWKMKEFENAFVPPGTHDVVDPTIEGRRKARSVDLNGVLFDNMLISSLSASSTETFITSDMGFTANGISFTGGNVFPPVLVP